MMAAIVGYAADRGASGKPLALFAAMLAGDAALLLFGFVWLLAFSGSANWIDQNNLVGSAFAGAIQPFIVWDILDGPRLLTAAVEPGKALSWQVQADQRDRLPRTCSAQSLTRSRQTICTRDCLR